MAKPNPESAHDALGPVPASEPYAEAVSRLAGVRHALRLVDDWGGGPADDASNDSDLIAGWVSADDSRRRLFDRESGRVVNAAAAGFEGLLNERQAQRTPHVEASRLLVEEIRRELAEVSRIVLR